MVGNWPHSATLPHTHKQLEIWGEIVILQSVAKRVNGVACHPSLRSGYRTVRCADHGGPIGSTGFGPLIKRGFDHGDADDHAGFRSLNPAYGAAAAACGLALPGGGTLFDFCPAAPAPPAYESVGVPEPSAVVFALASLLLGGLRPRHWARVPVRS